MNAKRITSLLLTAAIICGTISSAMAAGIPETTAAAEEDEQIVLVQDEFAQDDDLIIADETIDAEEIVLEDEQSLIEAEPENDDPEAYRATHRESIVEKNIPLKAEEVMMFGKTLITSIYNGKTYSVPSGVSITNGVDVSSWSEDVDWKKVKNAGTDFAILRCGYRGYGQAGNMVKDTYFNANVSGCKSAGVPAGVYIYSQAITTAEAREEAQFCLDAIKGKDIQMPIVMDIEYAENENGLCGRLYNANLSKSKMTDVAMAFCDVIEAAGYVPMIYANANMLTNKMDADKLSARCPIWMANYTTDTKYAGKYSIWQYGGSGTGKVPGIKNDADCNFGFDLAEMGMLDSVTLDHSKLTLVNGASCTLKAAVTPSSKANSLTWKSSDISVATVTTSGKVKAVNYGTAKITASIGTAKATCTVTVTPAEIDELSADASNGAIQLNWTAAVGCDRYQVYRSESWPEEDFAVIATVTDGKTTYTDTKVRSNTVYYYRVQPVVDVDGTYYYGPLTDMVAVQSGVMPTGITLDRTSAELTMDADRMTLSLNAAVEPANSQAEVIWSTSDKSVAKVSGSGKVTAVDSGKAVITATAGDKTAECKITVNPAGISNLELSKNEDGNIVLNWDASKGADRYYVYRSETSSGTYQGISVVKGDTRWKDTSATVGKKYYYCVAAVRVKDDVKYKGTLSRIVSGTPGIQNQKIKLSSTAEKLSLDEGKGSVTLTAKVTPEDDTIPVVWSTSDKKVATVSNGVVKAVKPGKAVITVTSGRASAQCTVTVDPAKPVLTMAKTEKSTGRIALAWTESAGSQEYTIYRSLDGTTWSRFKTAEGNKWTDTEVEAGKTYSYQVRGCATVGGTTFRSNGSNKMSATAGAATTSISLDYITRKLGVGLTRSLTATVKPALCLDKLKWKSSDPSVVKVSSSGKITMLSIGKATITATSGDKSASCVITVVPLKPTLESIEYGGSGAIKLTWTKSDSADAYEVYRSPNGDPETYQKIKTTAALTFRDTGLQKGKRYYYRVVAIKKIDGTVYRSYNSNRKSREVK